MHCTMNETKELILSRLFKSSSVCMCCNLRDCLAMNRDLPEILDRDDVLNAINLNEYFFKEEEEK